MFVINGISQLLKKSFCFCFCPYPLQTPVKDITQSGVVMSSRCWEEDLGRQLTPD